MDSFYDYWELDGYSMTQNNVVSINNYQKEQQLRKDKNFFDSIIKSRKRYTPDFGDLTAFGGDYFPVFLYGNEQARMKEEYTLPVGRCLFLGKAMTSLEHYILLQNQTNNGTAWLCGLLDRNISWEKSSYPFSASKKVFGELVGVPLNVLTTLDNKYENGEKATRSAVTVRLVGDDQKESLVRAWMYIHDLEFIETFPKFGTNKLLVAPWGQNYRGSYYHAIDTKKEV